jgi:hypothetical protein
MKYYYDSYTQTYWYQDGDGEWYEIEELPKKGLTN